MAVHYRQKHSGDRANLKCKLITTECYTVLRIIYEAFYNQKPQINDKSEVKLLHRFLVQCDVCIS